jgi:hypothetical protein
MECGGIAACLAVDGEVRFSQAGASKELVENSMYKFMYSLIPLVFLLLTACGAKNSFTITPTSSPESTPTQESTPMPTETSPSTSAQVPTPATPPVENRQDQPDANVTQVRAVRGDDGSWTFHVTVEHPDTGWEDYADGWDVVTPDGTVLKVNPDDPFTRLLLHPHETEQPFTRSQRGINIPAGVTQVRVRAHDIVDGFGGREILIDLEKDSGPGFEIER